MVPLFHRAVRNCGRRPAVLAEDRSPSGRAALLRDRGGSDHAFERHARQLSGRGRVFCVASHAGLVA